MVYYHVYCLSCIHFISQREVEQIKKKQHSQRKRETKYILLEKAKIELEELKKSIAKQRQPN